MADSALTGLPPVETTTDNDLFYTVQGGNSRQTTGAKIRAGAVRHDVEQTLDEPGKLRARSNISAASLGADGKVPLEELPDELFGDIETVDSEAEMLALDVPKGSIAVRTDVQKNFILKAEPASELANWVELATPTAPVTSVAGKTGNVELTPSDIDDSGNLQQLAALTLAARQILQTDETGALTALTLAARQILQTDVNGALKAVALAANKALVTDANQDVQQIDLSTIGRSILNMDGSADQLIRGDGTLIPILGTMDAGALMETGNNANGSYFRFRSGLQITARVSSTFTVQSPAGNMFVNGAAAPPYTLPATFSAEPYELITGHNLSGTGHCWAASVTRPTTTQSSSVQLFRATADAGPFFFRLVHIGRWQ